MSLTSSVREKLQSEFTPLHLQLVNESHQHNVPPDSETHFRVVLVSEQFAGKTAVARHQMVYKTLSDELSGGIHALSLHTYTPAEWLDEAADNVPASPPCYGGSAATGEDS